MSLITSANKVLYRVVNRNKYWGIGSILLHVTYTYEHLEYTERINFLIVKRPLGKLRKNMKFTLIGDDRKYMMQYIKELTPIEALLENL